MINKIFYYFNSKNILEIGNQLFLLGVLFLPSALPISGLLLLPALLISLIKKYNYFLNDKSNYYLFVAIGLILFSALNITFLNRDILLRNFDISLIWINLFNWLPIFIYYWGFQIYLKTHQQRSLFQNI